MLTNYDNIVFDLGGVVLDIERDRAVKALTELGIADADALLDPFRQKGIFLAVEEGQISAGEFFDALRSLSERPDVTDLELEKAFEAFIVDLPTERLRAIRKIRRMGKRTFVLSNTNPIMYNGVIERLFNAEAITINDYFDGIVVSFAEKVCKPESEIFHRLLARYNLDPSRTLFLDDSAENCACAEKMGIRSLLVKNTEGGFIGMLSLNE